MSEELQKAYVNGLEAGKQINEAKIKTLEADQKYLVSLLDKKQYDEWYEHTMGEVGE